MWPDQAPAPGSAANGGPNGRANGQHAELVVRSHAISMVDDAAGAGQPEAKAHQEALGAQQAAASRQPVAAGGLSTAGAPSCLCLQCSLAPLRDTRMRCRQMILSWKCT